MTAYGYIHIMWESVELVNYLFKVFKMTIKTLYDHIVANGFICLT